MEEEKIIKGVEQFGVDFITNHFYELSERKRKEIISSCLYIIQDNDLTDELIEELTENL